MFAEVADGSNDATLSDVARLPVEVLPEVGRAMGVLGPEAVSIQIAVTAGD